MTSFSFILPCLLFVAMCVLISCAGLLLFKKLLDGKITTKFNDVTGILFSVIGLLYSLILAFVVIAVWEDYEENSQNVAKEATRLNDLFTYSVYLPDSVGLPLRNGVVDYAQTVVNDEWNKMENNQTSELAYSYILKIRMQAIIIMNDEHIQHDVKDAIIKCLIDVRDMRDARLQELHSHLPGIVWFVLICGSFICIIASYFLQIENKNFQMVITALLSALIGMVLFMGIALNNPFSGSSKISSEPFEVVMNRKVAVN